jgi:hypothetical protein
MLVATYFARVEGTPFLFISSFYLSTYLQRYVGHTYVLNSDEGLTARAQAFRQPRVKTQVGVSVARLTFVSLLNLLAAVTTEEFDPCFAS